jgi:signal transduction histidine kinase
MSDMGRLLEVIMGEARTATDAESCSLALYDERSDELYFYVAQGEQGEGHVERKLKCVRMKMGTGIIGSSASSRKSLNIKNAYKDPRFDRQADEKTGFVTRSILAVPMIRRGKLIGVVEAVNKKNTQAFSAHDEKVLAVLAAQAATAIENARLYEENLQQARLSALGQAVAGSAHCIKNIMQGIVGGAYVLELGIQREEMENITKGWGVMKRNVQFMREIMLDMLAYSRPEKLNCAPSDVNRICLDVVELLKAGAGQKNVDLALEPQPDLRHVILDPKAIYRCILNLVTNALDACDKAQGVVRIKTGLAGAKDRLEITISDNGCGISEENLKNLFRVFFSTKGSKGTGLGLAVTQKIILEHGGEIQVESKVGSGTTFRIMLPLKVAS